MSRISNGPWGRTEAVAEIPRHDFKDACKYATAAALPAYVASGASVGKRLTMVANGALTVDGDVVAQDDRVFVRSEAGDARVHHGIYYVSVAGDLTHQAVLVRAEDADEDAEFTSGMRIWITHGAANAKSGWLLTTADPIVVDTTIPVFIQFTGLGDIEAGAGLTKTGNTLDVGAGNGIQVNPDTVETIYGVVGSVQPVGDAAAAGAANAASRVDHIHVGRVVEKGVVETADGAQTTLLSVALADDTVYALRATVTARRTDVAGRARYVREAVVYRAGGGGAALQGDIAIPVPDIESVAAWDATFDVSGNNARVRVTGAAVQTVRWACDVELARAS